MQTIESPYRNPLYKQEDMRDWKKCNGAITMPVDSVSGYGRLCMKLDEEIIEGQAAKEICTLFKVPAENVSVIYSQYLGGFVRDCDKVDFDRVELLPKTEDSSPVAVLQQFSNGRVYVVEVHDGFAIKRTKNTRGDVEAVLIGNDKEAKSIERPIPIRDRDQAAKEFDEFAGIVLMKVRSGRPARRMRPGILGNGE